MRITARNVRRSAALLICAGALLAPGRLPALDDRLVQCRAVDPEISSHLLAYQLGNRLYVQRLAAAPGVAGPFLRGGPLRVDSGLPSAGQTYNGPEIGLDATLGFEVVYTKQDAERRWYLARAAYGCEPRWSDACFVRASWEIRDFPNLAAFDHRWRPYASADASHAAWVAYLRGTDLSPPPHPASADRQLAWRLLEEENSQETVAAGADALYTGIWVDIDGQPRIVTPVGPLGADLQVALIDLSGPAPAITPITSGSGLRTEPVIWFDPASASYLLAYLWREGNTAASNEMRFHRRDGATGLWPADPFLAFTARDAEGDPGTTREWLLSLEPFVDAGTGTSYLAFSTGDERAFGSVTDGNVWYVQVDATGPGQPAFRRVNDTTHLTKRMEPEIHYPRNDGPVIYFTQIATAGDAECTPGEPTLRRARTGLAAPPAAR
jgi:hypothetical protein